MSVAGQTAQPLPLTLGAVSDVGRRGENQDCMAAFSSAFGAVYLIADGMGGHQGGAVASHTAIDAFTKHLLAAPATSPPHEVLDSAVRQASVEVAIKGNADDAALRGMGSTIVVALIFSTSAGLQMQTAHVGDSRVYLLRDRQLMLLTRDHTQIQWMIDSHTIDEATARNHPGSSVLTRALGHTADLHADISDPMALSPGDCILLCSDGLSGFASFEQIHAALQQHIDPAVRAQALVELALHTGSDDNITVQVLHIGPQQEPAPAPRPRKTEPEGSTIPAEFQLPRVSRQIDRTRSKRTAAVLLLLLLCTAAGAVMAFRHWHRGPSPLDPMLAARIRNFHAAATDLHNQASTGQAAAHQDSATFADAKGTSTKDKSSRSRRKELQEKYAGLSARYDAILAEADRLEQENRELEAAMDALVPRRRSSAQSETEATITQLKQRVQTDEIALEACRKNLAVADGRRRDLGAHHV